MRALAARALRPLAAARDSRNSSAERSGYTPKAMGIPVVSDGPSSRMRSARGSKCPASLAREFDRDEESFWVEVALSRFVDDANQTPGLGFGIRNRPVDLPDDERSTEPTIGDTE